MKFCKDCKHYREHQTVPATCESPNLPTDLVTGSPKFALCKDMRYPDSYVLHEMGFGGYCGEDGKWYEPRVFEPTSVKDADLDDLSKIPFGK
jgi:hypothetical protein